MGGRRIGPDFIIIGARKCGTTSLFNWLGEQPEVFMPSVKEPAFFSREHNWSRGLDWYQELFGPAEEGQLTGEASGSYTSPDYCAVAARRMAETVPTARLIYLVRHPLEMIRSQYRHQAQRGRERRPLVKALSHPGNPYLRHSMFFSCLEPYIRSFRREQICVVRFEDLVGAEGTGWADVLLHLGLTIRPRPDTAHNVSAEKAPFRAAMPVLEKVVGLDALARLPAPIRRVGRGLLTTSQARAQARLRASDVDVPQDLLLPVWEDVERLEQWLDRRLWSDSNR